MSPNSAVNYLICTAPRTGSTLLAEALSSTGRAGSPDEFFKGYEPLDRLWREAFGIECDADYFDKVRAARTGANGVFGFKLLWPQGPALMAKLRASAALKYAPSSASVHELLTMKLGAAPRYVWLRRKNKLAQAISYLRADSTRIWRSNDIPQGGRQADANLQFDFESIVRYLRAVNGFDTEWACFFLAHRVQMLLITYEELTVSYEATVLRVLEFLEVPREGVSVAPPALRRQSDARSDDWERRFLELARARGLELPELFGPT